MKKRMRRFSITKRIAACLMTLTLAAGSFTGCGDNSAPTDNTDGSEANSSPAVEEAAQDEEQGTAMGRYVGGHIHG